MNWDGFAVAAANHLWQSTLFPALAALFAIVLRRKNARLHYWIWFFASMKFLVPFSLLVSLGQRFAWAPLPAPAGPAIRVIEPVILPMVPINSNLITAPAYIIAPVEGGSGAVQILVALWLAGLAAVLAYRLVIACRLRVLRRRAEIASRGVEIEALARAQSRNGSSTSIGVALSQSAIEPGVHGILRPVLLFPAGLAGRLEEEQLDSIMAHELSHVRRHDNLTAVLHVWVETVFWFHPLVWWIGSRIVEERERACDEDVLRSGNDPDAYASAILTVCEFYMSSGSLTVAGIMGSNLKTRIETIMNMRQGARLGFLGRLMLTTTALLSVCMPVLYGTTRGTYQAGPTTAANGPSFEVASVRPAPEGVPRLMLGGVGGFSMPLEFPACRGTNSPSYANAPLNRCVSKGHTLKWLIALAYEVPWEQINTLIAGGPEWVDTDKFAVEAKAESSSTESALHVMLQRLLAREFNLKFHREKKEMRVLALVVAKGRPKFSEVSKGRNCSDGVSDCSMAAGSSGVKGRAQSMEALASTLSMWTRQTIVDKTGLTGLYDFEAGPYRVDNTKPVGPDDEPILDPDALPTIFTALQEQLGLRLEPQRAEVDVLVIDSAVRP